MNSKNFQPKVSAISVQLKLMFVAPDVLTPNIFYLRVFVLEWTGNKEDEDDVNVWEDNWDDDNVEDDFNNQLRAQLESQKK